MDHEIINTLKQAAVLIKEKQLKAARTMLVELLRDHPEIDHAWYMLSFTVPVVDRQVYALEQALKINPNNEKALVRLRKLKGESEPPKDAFSFRKTKPQKDERLAPQPDQSMDADTGDDLLSRRLMGGVDTEPPTEEPVVEESPPEVERPPIEEALPEKEPAPPDPEEAPKKKEERYSRKVFGIRRSLFLLLILILIFISLGILGYSDYIKEIVAGFQGSAPTVQSTLDEGSGGGEDSAGISTEQPTATSGIELPPVWTPTPTVEAAPTDEPEDLALHLSNEIIDFESLPVPEPAVQSEFEEIRLQMSAMMDDADLPITEGYLVEGADLQNTLSEFARLNSYRDQTDQLSFLFTGLGLIENWAVTDSMMQNMWADPNGTLLFLDNGKVIITDYEASQYQRYSYAKEVAQNYRNQQNPLHELGIYPMCSPVDQSCDILYGLTKGEAAYFAGRWAFEYMGETAFLEYSEEPVIRLTVPVVEPPLFLEPALAFPDSFGQDFVEDIYQLGGLDAVSAVYGDLPETTEQLMHPEKYQVKEGPVEIQPLDISTSLGVSWQEVFKGTLGEWKTYLILAYQVAVEPQTSSDQARVAAAGWGGDYAQIYFRNSTQEYVVVGEWAWDSPTDAAEFLNSFSQTLSRKTGALKIDLDSEADCYMHDYGLDCVFAVDQNTSWLHTPDTSTMELLLASIPK